MKAKKLPVLKIFMKKFQTRNLLLLVKLFLCYFFSFNFQIYRNHYLFVGRRISSSIILVNRLVSNVIINFFLFYLDVRRVIVITFVRVKMKSKVVKFMFFLTNHVTSMRLGNRFFCL